MRKLNRQPDFIDRDNGFWFEEMKAKIWTQEYGYCLYDLYMSADLDEQPLLCYIAKKHDDDEGRLIPTHRNVYLAFVCWRQRITEKILLGEYG